MERVMETVKSVSYGVDYFINLVVPLSDDEKNQLKHMSDDGLRKSICDWNHPTDRNARRLAANSLKGIVYRTVERHFYI